MEKSKFFELLEELRLIFTGRSFFLDIVLPPALFLLVNGLAGFQAAMWSALALALILAALRIARKQPLTYALGGIASVALAIGVVQTPWQITGFLPARPRQRQRNPAALHPQPCDPPPNGGMDKFHRTPLAIGLVLAPAGAPRIQRDHARLGAHFCRPAYPASFGLPERRATLLALTNSHHRLAFHHPAAGADLSLWDLAAGPAAGTQRGRI